MRYKIFNIFIDDVSMDEALNKIKEFIKEDKLHIVVTPNLLTVALANKDKEFQDIINNADLIIQDGIGISLLAKLFNQKLNFRIPGIDLMLNICELAKKEGYTIFLLGAKEEVVKDTKYVLEKKYNGLRIVGYHNGYFNDEEEVIQMINDKKPDILFIAMGQPKQEKLINKYLKELSVKICMGVGGSFDVISGRVKRAPQWIQNYGLEWLYRMIQQPQKILRIFSMIKLLVIILIKKNLRTLLSYGSK